MSSMIYLPLVFLPFIALSLLIIFSGDPDK